MGDFGDNVIRLEERVRLLRQDLATRSFKSATADLLVLQDAVRQLALVIGIAELYGHPLSKLADINAVLDQLTDMLRDIGARLG